MAATSSVGWLGCSRKDIRPGRPKVALASVTTWIFLAAITRSMLDISLAQAAMISGVSPEESARASSPVVRRSSSHSRRSETVQELTREKIAPSRLSSTLRVTSSIS